MSSGDLRRAIVSGTANLSDPTKPLPDDLQQVVNAYLDKHPNPDDQESQHLQDDLLAIYQSTVLDHPSRLAPFLMFLLPLKQNISGSGRLLQWWDKLSVPVLDNIGVEKGLAVMTRNTLLAILVVEDDDPNVEDAKATSDALSETLMATWLERSKTALDQFDGRSQFVAEQIQLILVAFGKKRPKDFLTTIDKFFVKKDSRILALSLLCEFFRHQPPHLHQLLQTPLFDNLLKCLQIDTSTRVISLAMTALVMFLPHIPSTTSKHLPALFNIYSRLLFWDRERRASDAPSRDEDDEKSEKDEPPPEQDKSWVKLSYLLESEDEKVPELLHYFTFLYGLYPINFMSYIRKPQRYLRHADFGGAEDLDIEPTEIRERSEPFRRVHLLHPNFFMLTLETELTDNNRWQKSEAADVVAECMALYSPGEDFQGHNGRSRGPAQKIELNADVPDHPLLDGGTPYQSRHASWRITGSTAVASPTENRHPGLQRQYSQTSQSQSMPSIADSPSLHPSERHDSPTIPPQMMASPSTNQLSDMLNTQKSIRGSLYQALTNDSAGSLPLSNGPNHVDAYLASLGRETIPRSPSLRPATNDPNLKVAYLHREIQLLRNDLNFERYLKQQHLSHIGQLRRQQIKEARVEAETQNMVNTNRILKNKLEAAKQAVVQMKKESEKSKTHSRKWEGELTAKLRVLREEQKKWNLEREELKRDLEIAVDTADKLKQIVVTAESRELSAKQQILTLEANAEELERLRTEVENLTLRIMKYEARDLDFLRREENEANALARVKVLEMKLDAYERDLEMAKRKFRKEQDERIESLMEEKEERYVQKTTLTQEFLDSAIEASRLRILELQKKNANLSKKYTRLNAAYVDLREQYEQKRYEEGDDSLLGGGSTVPYLSQSPTSPTAHGRMGGGHRRHPNATSDPDYDATPKNISPARPGISSLDTNVSESTSMSTSPIEFKTLKSSGQSTSTGAIDGLDAYGKKKIKPASEVRVYGRGGPQNIGKAPTPKDKKLEKGKEREASPLPSPDKEKKEKKSVGIRGIRGFV